MKTPIVYTVDDDEVYLTMIAQVLKKYGVQSENFKTTQEFLSRLSVKLPDLCLIDLNIERTGSGLELIETIRKQVQKTLPLIVVTTETDPTLIASAIENGADDYIFKPINREVLTAKLLEYFQTQELEFAKMVEPTEVDTDISTEIITPLQVVQIDEMGLTILSPHLFPKGMVVSLDSEFLHSLVTRPGRFLLTVLNSQLETKEPESFRVYLEFDSTDTELLSAVRHWIGQSRAKAK